MQVQYSSASKPSSKARVTLEGSGHAAWVSGVTLASALSPVLVGVHGSRVEVQGYGVGGRLEGRGKVCWACLHLK